MKKLIIIFALVFIGFNPYFANAFTVGGSVNTTGLNNYFGNSLSGRFCTFNSAGTGFITPYTDYFESPRACNVTEALPDYNVYTGSWGYLGTVSASSITWENTACTDFTYSDWSTCSDSSQTRTVVSSLPANCVAGTPDLTQSCIMPEVGSLDTINTHIIETNTKLDVLISAVNDVNYNIQNSTSTISSRQDFLSVQLNRFPYLIDFAIVAIYAFFTIALLRWFYRFFFR